MTTTTMMINCVQQHYKNNNYYIFSACTLFSCSFLPSSPSSKLRLAQNLVSQLLTFILNSTGNICKEFDKRR
jgi:hypothetical protein